MKVIRSLVVLGLIGGAAGWVLTAPQPLPASALEGLTGDPVRGETIFAAAGCASCHVAADAPAADLPVLAGGQRFETAFGTFVAPNISPSPEGVGDWTDLELVSATMTGVSPEGAHFFPAFPYDAYSKAEPQDMLDLVAYLRTLPADATPSGAHELGFPFNIRRAVGGWKLLFASDQWVLADAPTPQVERGRYLVEALGHCAECHTPRNALGGLNRSDWLAGGPNPDGEGTIPNITPGKLTWTENDIAYYLETGFTPDFDSVGGSMAHVVRNTARLMPEDRLAIAAYLKAVPAVE
jgi:mono/diheme cytochrome c family protein